MAKQHNGIKYCPRCKKELPINKFGSDVSSSDGLQTYCINCKNEASREQYRNRDVEKMLLIKKLVNMLKPYRKEQSYENSKNRINPV